MRKLRAWFSGLHGSIKVLIWLLCGVFLGVFIFELLPEFYPERFGFLSLDHPLFYLYAIVYIAIPFIVIWIQTGFQLKRKRISEGSFTAWGGVTQSYIKEKVGNVVVIGTGVPWVYDDKGIPLNVTDDGDVMKLDDVEYFPYTGNAPLYLRSHDYSRFSGREWIVDDKSILIKLNDGSFRKKLSFSDVKGTQVAGETFTITVDPKHINAKAEKANAYAIDFDIGGEQIAEIIRARITSHS